MDNYFTVRINLISQVIKSEIFLEFVASYIDFFFSKISTSESDLLIDSSITSNIYSQYSLDKCPHIFFSESAIKQGLFKIINTLHISIFPYFLK